MPGKPYNARRVFRGMVIEKTPAELVAAREAKTAVVEAQDAVPEATPADAVPSYGRFGGRDLNAPLTGPLAQTTASGLAGKILGAIDRADAQGRGCAGCKAVRKVARKMITKIARPQRGDSR